MKKIFFSLLLICLSCIAFSQTDTVKVRMIANRGDGSLQRDASAPADTIVDGYRVGNSRTGESFYLNNKKVKVTGWFVRYAYPVPANAMSEMKKEGE